MPLMIVTINRRPGRRVGPGLAQRSELGTGLGNLLEDVEEIPGRAGQPVESGDQHEVAFAEHVQQPVQLRPATLCAGYLLAIDLRSAGLVQLGLLRSQSLAGGRDERITVSRHQTIPFRSKRYKPNMASAN
jgi:hypothetical protein